MDPVPLSSVPLVHEELGEVVRVIDLPGDPVKVLTDLHLSGYVLVEALHRRPRLFDVPDRKDGAFGRELGAGRGETRRPLPYW